MNFHFANFEGLFINLNSGDAFGLVCILQFANFPSVVALGTGAIIEGGLFIVTI